MQLNNYTQISNEFLECLPEYGESEIKIFLAISRKTIGWHKVSDRISYSQLKKMTGLSVNSIKKGIENLITGKWIIQTKSKNGYHYDLNIDNVSNNAISNFDTENTETISKIDTVEPKTISKIDTTKESNINKEYKENKNPSKKFIKPSKEEAKQFCINHNFKSDSDVIYDYYESNGWMVGKNKMRDWQASYRNWERRDFNNQKNKPETPAERYVRERKEEEARKNG